jgi:hypothetical protein
VDGLPDSEKEAAFRGGAAFLEAHKPAKWQHLFDDDVDEHALPGRGPAADAL